MPRRKQSQHSITGSTTVPKELHEDYEAYEALRTSPEGLEWVNWAVHIWNEIALDMNRAWLELGEPPDATVIDLIVSGVDESIVQGFQAFNGPAPPWADLSVVFIAYLGRKVRQRVVRAEEMIDEMINAWLWLRMVMEFNQRINRHPMAALLWIAAFGPHESDADKAAAMWLRHGERMLSMSWVHGVVGEVDPQAARSERTSLLGQRLAEEIRRLHHQGPEVVTADVMAGRLNYSRNMARQAVLRGQRSPQKRHQQLEDPEGIPDPFAEYEAEAVEEDPERMATDIIDTFRLSLAEAKVVRLIVSRPLTYSERLTKPEIAQEAGVSLSTAEATIRKLAGDRPTLLRILRSR